MVVSEDTYKTEDLQKHFLPRLQESLTKCVERKRQYFGITCKLY